MVMMRMDDRCSVAWLTFVIEAVDPVNRGALVVTPKDEEVLRVLDLVCQQEADGLEALFSSVHIITVNTNPHIQQNNDFTIHIALLNQGRTLHYIKRSGYDRDGRRRLLP